MRNIIESHREAGFLLGPLFHEFCCRLFWVTANQSPENDALLFMARGGLRLQYLFELFLKVQNLDFKIPCFPFWISRFFGVKMTFQENPELAVANLVREFSYTNCLTMAAALLPASLYPDLPQLLQSIPQDTAAAPVTRESFFKLYYHPCPYSVKLREHFTCQHDYGHRVFREKFGRFKNLHTVDSGWFGSTLGTLQTGCTQWHWDALYFGRWNYRNDAPWYFNDIVGLMIDAVGLQGKNAVDVFLEYHHILEAVLEPEIPSVEYYLEDGSCNAMIPDWEKRIAGDDSDDLWTGVKDYFLSKPSIDILDCTRETAKVLKRWTRLLRYPTAEEAVILTVPPRSADFGKNESTPIFTEPDRSSFSNYWHSVRCSLWPAGMIAVTSRKGIFLKQLFWHTCKKLIHYKGAV